MIFLLLQLLSTGIVAQQASVNGNWVATANGNACAYIQSMNAYERECLTINTNTNSYVLSETFLSDAGCTQPTAYSMTVSGKWMDQGANPAITGWNKLMMSHTSVTIQALDAVGVSTLNAQCGAACGASWTIGQTRTFDLTAAVNCCPLVRPMDYTSFQASATQLSINNACDGPVCGYANTTLDTAFVPSSVSCPDYTMTPPGGLQGSAVGNWLPIGMSGKLSSCYWDAPAGLFEQECLTINSDNTFQLSEDFYTDMLCTTSRGYSYKAVGSFIDQGPNPSVPGYNRLQISKTVITLMALDSTGLATLSSSCPCGATAWTIGVAQTFATEPKFLTCCSALVSQSDYLSWRVQGSTLILTSSSPTPALGYAMTSIDTTLVMTSQSCPDFSAVVPANPIAITLSCSVSTGGIIALVIICTIIILGAIYMLYRDVNKNIKYRMQQEHGDNSMPAGGGNASAGAGSNENNGENNP